MYLEVPVSYPVIGKWTDTAQPHVERDPISMNSQWKNFLESRSARIDNEDNVRFPDAPVEAECALVDLSHLGLLAVSGSEAASFLQGQLTNDIQGLSGNRSQLAGHCSPKGRMLASFRVFKTDDTFYLQLPRARVDAVVKRLRMYLLRSKAAVEDASDRFVAIGIAGDCAPSSLASRLEAIPDRDNGVTRSGETIVIRVPGPAPRFEILGPATPVQALWDGLATDASVANADYWSLLNIRAGIPSVFPQTSEAFVPQMANLQILDGVSFKKGCYTGQEVVARMQYLGKLKRRMYRAQVSTDRPPLPGDELHRPSSSPEKAAGKIVDARINGNGDYELLAVVEIEAAEKGEVRLGGPDGPILSFSEPPYGFPPGR